MIFLKPVTIMGHGSLTKALVWNLDIEILFAVHTSLSYSAELPADVDLLTEFYLSGN